MERHAANCSIALMLLPFIEAVSDAAVGVLMQNLTVALMSLKGGDA